MSCGIMRHINVTLHSQCLVIMNKIVSYISSIKEEGIDMDRDNCCPSFCKVLKALSFQLQNPFCLLSWRLLLPSPLPTGPPSGGVVCYIASDTLRFLLLNLCMTQIAQTQNAANISTCLEDLL